MDAHEAMKWALSGLSCPAGRAPVADRPDTYVSWFEVTANVPVAAAGRAKRRMRMLQVDIFSREPLDELRESVIKKLQGAGFHIPYWGPEAYEQDTRYRHLPITCRWYETI